MKCKINIIRNRPRHKIRVDTFDIYSLKDKEDPEVIRLEKLLAENPSYEKVYWQQQGPCSNWGYDVYRPETDDEYAARMSQESEKRAWNRTKRQLKYQGMEKLDVEVQITH